MYRVNKRILMDTAPSLTSFAGNIRSTLLGGNNSTNSYVITDKLNQRAVGQTVLFDMYTPTNRPDPNNIILTDTTKGVAFKILNASRIWYEDDNGEIKEGGRYELERDDVSTALHILSDTYPTNQSPLKIMLTQAPATFIRTYPNTYTGSKLALSGKILKRSIAYGQTIKLLFTDGFSSNAKVLDSSSIYSAATNTDSLIKTLEGINSGDIKSSNVRIRIGFSVDEVSSIIKTFRHASYYQTLADRIMYETGNVFFSVGSSTLNFNTCDDSGLVGDANSLGIGSIGDSEEINIVDEAGFVRRWNYNGTTYNFPVLDIAPVAMGYEDELFKIKQLSNLSPGDIAASMVSLIANIVGGIPTPATGAIAATMRSIELVPSEYKASFSYAMFQMSGLKELGNSVLNMKSKERSGSSLFNDVRPMYGYHYADVHAIQPVQQLSSSDYSNIQGVINITPAGNTFDEMYNAMMSSDGQMDQSSLLEFSGYIRHKLDKSEFPYSLYEPLNDFLKSGFAFVNGSKKQN